MSKPVGAFNGVTRGPVGGAFRGATPSGHPETARGLNERSVLLASMMLETDGLPTTCAGDFEAALLTLLDTKGCKLELGDMAPLVEPLSKTYERGSKAGEVMFDIMLFQGLVEYLGDFVLSKITLAQWTRTRQAKTPTTGRAKRQKTHQETDNLKGEEVVIVVLKGTWDHDGITYALGFSRQVTSEGLGIPLHFGCALKGRHDHSCVLLQKKHGENNSCFDIVDASATVELKHNESTCKLEKRQNSFLRKLKAPPILATTDGSIAQVVAYSLSDVWSCVARRGMKLEEEDYVRFGILACKIKRKKKTQTEEKKATTAAKKPKQAPKERKNTSNEAKAGNRPTLSPSTRPASVVNASNQWLVGRVLIPDRCGDVFKYQIDDFGSFSDQLNNNRKAAHAYLHVFTHGVKLINSFKLACANSRPRPLSGKKLHFNNVILDQATYEMSPFYRREGASPIESSQGELLSLTLTPEVWKKMSIAHEDVIVLGEYCDNVMVKVSSVPIFNSICAPTLVFYTMQNRSKQLPVFGEVLLAMCRTTVGLITVLRDLRSELKCKDLSPSTYISGGGELSDLWKSFVAFVDKWMIPMARKDVIHTDIRPGYDWTANIMIDENGDMWPIDFESVVRCKEYKRPPNDARYFDQDVASSGAFDFAVVQCIAIGYTWLTETNQMAVDLSEIEDMRYYIFGEKKVGIVSESDLRDALRSIGSLVGSKRVFRTLSGFKAALEKNLEQGRKLVPSAMHGIV